MRYFCHVTNIFARKSCLTTRKASIKRKFLGRIETIFFVFINYGTDTSGSLFKWTRKAVKTQAIDESFNSCLASQKFSRVSPQSLSFITSVPNNFFFRIS